MPGERLQEHYFTEHKLDHNFMQRRIIGYIFKSYGMSSKHILLTRNQTDIDIHATYFKFI